MDRKEKQIQLKMSYKEYEILNRKAEIAHLGLSTYIRKAALDAEITTPKNSIPDLTFIQKQKPVFDV